MNGTPQAAAETVALYARVSTEDQAERDTVKTQLDFLRRYCDLYGLPIAGEYVDDGISGTVAVDRRPEGQRLIADAEAKRFGAVVFYKLSRLGRKLDVILDAYTALDALGVTIRSATEPLDTSDANGRCNSRSSPSPPGPSRASNHSPPHLRHTNCTVNESDHTAGFGVTD
jgi:DNA invertase Pin-like site-specific DNA recombinase